MTILEQYLLVLGTQTLTDSTDDGRIQNENTGLLADSTHRVTTKDGSPYTLSLNSVYGKVAEQTNREGVLTANTAPTDDKANNNAGYYAFVTDFAYDSNAGFDEFGGGVSLFGDFVSFDDLYINGQSLLNSNYWASTSNEYFDKGVFNISLTGLSEEGILQEGNNNFSFLVHQQNSTYGKNTEETLGFQAFLFPQETSTGPDDGGGSGGDDYAYGSIYFDGVKQRSDDPSHEQNGYPISNHGSVGNAEADNRTLFNNGSIDNLEKRGDGGMGNFGEIGNAILYDGQMVNDGGTISSAIVQSAAALYNAYSAASGGTPNGLGNSYSSINDADVYGSLHNGQNGYISTAYVNSGGFLGNLGNIGTVNLSSGEVHNGDYYRDGNFVYGYGDIDNVQMYGGMLYNESGSNIDNANVNGGTLYNHGSIGLVAIDSELHNYGQINNASVHYGSTLNNERDGTINNVNVNGGTLNNYGSQYSYYPTNGIEYTQVVSGTLNNEQYGLLRIANFANGSSEIAGKVTNVDLNNARLVVESDLTSIADFDLLSLFGLKSDAFTGGLDDIFSFSILLGGEEGLVSIIEDGILSEDFVFASDGGFGISYVVDDNNGGGNAAPEPATLLIMGLGIAGLAAARRRRK